MSRGNPNHRNQFLRTQERDKYGVIVTARVNGLEISVSRGGKALDALRVIIAVMEQMGEVEVLSISTPGTIYGDLTAARRREFDPTPGLGGNRAMALLHPEPIMLRRIGKAHLWRAP